MVTIGNLLKGLESIDHRASAVLRLVESGQMSVPKKYLKEALDYYEDGGYLHLAIPIAKVLNKPNKVFEAYDTLGPLYLKNAAEYAQEIGRPELAREYTNQDNARLSEEYERKGDTSKAIDFAVQAGLKDRALHLAREKGDLITVFKIEKNRRGNRKTLERIIRNSKSWENCLNASELAKKRGFRDEAERLHQRSTDLFCSKLESTVRGDYRKSLAEVEKAKWSLLRVPGVKERKRKIFRKASREFEKKREYLAAFECAYEAGMFRRSLSLFPRFHVNPFLRFGRIYKKAIRCAEILGWKKRKLDLLVESGNSSKAGEFAISIGEHNVAMEIYAAFWNYEDAARIAEKIGDTKKRDIYRGLHELAGRRRI